MNKNSDCAILVLSCDKYSDLWDPFFYCFNKYWKDCPYRLYLGSNTINFKDKKIKTLLSGPDKDWSSSLLAILKKMREKNIFLWLDDIFLTSEVDKNVIEASFEYLMSNKAKHIHISNVPKADRIAANNLFGVLDKRAPYRVNAFGFWNKTALENLLIKGETPWNFEIMGSYRSSYEDGYYTLLKKPFSYLNTVEKGKYFSGMKLKLKELGIQAPLVRDELIEVSKLRSFIQKVFFNLMIQVPWRIRLKIMNIHRKLLITY